MARTQTYLATVTFGGDVYPYLRELETEILYKGETMAPELNVDLLDKTLDHIETLYAYQQEGLDLETRWNQGTWGHLRYDSQGATCGTTMCFAGHAVVLAGHRVAPEIPGSRWLTVVDHPDGRRSIERIAGRELGLTPRESMALFAGSNTITDLRERVAAIKAGAYRG